MPFCSHCGNALAEDDVFCGVCGTSVQSASSANPPTPTPVVPTATKQLPTPKTPSGGLLKDIAPARSSAILKVACVLLLSFCSSSLFHLIYMYLIPSTVNELSWWDYNLCSYGFMLLVFGLLFLLAFAPFLRPFRRLLTCGKGTIIQTVWITLLLLKVVDMDLHFWEHIYALWAIPYTSAISFLVVLMAVWTIYSRHSISPWIPMLTLIVCNRDFLSLALWDAVDLLGTVIVGAIVALVFLGRYFLPRKVANIIVWVLAFLGIALSLVVMFINIADEMDLHELYVVIDRIIFVLLVALFSVAYRGRTCKTCGSQLQHNGYCKHCHCAATETSKKARLPIVQSVIGLGVGAMVFTALALGSGLYTATYINENLNGWKESVKRPYLCNWDDLEDDMRNASSVSTTHLFVEDYDSYTTIKTNLFTMTRIEKCYDAYQKGQRFDKELQSDYDWLSIIVDEDWGNDPLLSASYKRWMAIQPSEDLVTVSATRTDGKFIVKVTNKNPMPLNSCQVKLDLRYMYIFLESYRDPAWGSGSEVVTLEDVAPNATVTATIEVDPEDYFKSYGSYFMANLYESNVYLISID